MKQYRRFFIQAALILIAGTLVAQQSDARLTPYRRVFADGLQGLMDLDGTIRVDIAYDYVDPDFGSGLARFRRDDRFGYLDLEGNEIIAPRFDGAADFAHGTALVIEDGRYGVIDRTGAYLLRPEFDAVGKFRDDFLEVSRDGRYGVVHRSGKEILPAKYDSVTILAPGDPSYVERYYGYEADETVVIVRGRNGSSEVSGVYRLDGTPIKENIAGRITRIYDGSAIYRIGDRVGFISKEGRIVVIPQYSDARPFRDGYAWVETGDGWGAIDSRGALIEPHTYYRVYASLEDTVQVKTSDGQRGIASNNGRLLTPVAYDQIYTRSDHFFARRRIDGGGYATDVYDLSGTMIATYTGTSFNYQYDFIVFTDPDTEKTIIETPWTGKRLETDYTGVTRIALIPWGDDTDIEKSMPVYRFVENGRFGLLRGDLEVVVPPEYEQIGSYGGGFFPATRGDEKLTLRVSVDGVESFPYDWVRVYSETAYQVQKDGKIGFIRRSDRSVVTPPSIDRIWYLEDGEEGPAVFAINYTRHSSSHPVVSYKVDLSTNRGIDEGDFGYVNRDGEIMIPAIFDCAYEFSEGLAVVRFGDLFTGKRGYINLRGELVIPPAFDYAYSFEDGVACVIVDEQPGYIDTEGNWIYGPSL